MGTPLIAAWCVVVLMILQGRPREVIQHAKLIVAVAYSFAKRAMAEHSGTQAVSELIIWRTSDIEP